MAQENNKRERIVGFSARVLNEAGTAVVDLYDFSTRAVDSVFSFSKKTSSGLPEKTKKFVQKGVDYIYPGESKTIRDRIKIKEEKIEKIYQEIGREETKQLKTGDRASDASENIRNLVSDVRDYEGQIKKLKGKVSDIETEKIEAKERKIKREKEAKEAKRIAEIRKKETRGIPAQDVIKKAIASSLKSFKFESVSERSIFEKVANDLLSQDQEVRILAANELAKMKNEAAVPVLTEAVEIGDPNLTSEIINALISIGSVNAVPLFKEKVTDMSYRIRVACLRGLYKLAEDDDEALRLLANAVKDEHPEVRKYAITFIGWKDNAEAVPALVQSLRDDDNDVKKAALSALATIRDKATVLPVIRVLGDDDPDIRQKALDAIRMITGEEIAFDLQTAGDDLSGAVDNLIDWWQKKRTGEAELSNVEEQPADAEGSDVEEAVSEAVAAEEGVEEIEEHTEAALTRLPKVELLSICSDKGLQSNANMTKNEIIQIILDSQK